MADFMGEAFLSRQTEYFNSYVREHLWMACQANMYSWIYCMNIIDSRCKRDADQFRACDTPPSGVSSVYKNLFNVQSN